jgi:hypothetical protein
MIKPFLLEGAEPTGHGAVCQLADLPEIHLAGQRLKPNVPAIDADW